VAAVFIIASTSAAIALTVVFGELGLLVLAVSYVVAFFLLVVPLSLLFLLAGLCSLILSALGQTGITKWRPFKHCCYEKAGKGRASKREPSTKTDLDQDQVL